MLRNRSIIVSLVAVVLIICLISVTAREREHITRLEQVVTEALAPLETGLAGVRGWVGDRFRAITELGQLRAENKRLKAELERLSGIDTDHYTLLAENERLRAELGFAKSVPGTKLAAEVIGRNSDNWFGSLTINRGSDDGIVKDMPVLAATGVVGRIITVTPHTSTVMLLLDPASGVGGMVQRTGEFGIVKGQSSAEGQSLAMNLFDGDADVMVGDTILTSGLGGGFPKGLLVGQVEQVELHELGLFRSAVVKPAVDLGRVTEVFVLTGTTGGGSR